VEVDRRNTARRTEIVQAVLDEIVHGGVSVVTVDRLQESVQVPSEVAKRIVDRLVSAGLLTEAGRGVWVRVPL